MTFTLGEITYRVARELGIVFEGTATGGTVSTLVDANDRTEADNHWQKGTLWITRDAAGLGAAPENEFTIISSSTSSTGTLTLRNSLTAAPASGDRYAVTRKFGDMIWLDVLKQKINQAIAELGTIPYSDVTSITTASNQTEYTLPVAAKQSLMQVWIQTDNTDVDDNRWQELRNYDIGYADPGVAENLILPAQYSAGYRVKLVYMAKHPELKQYTDVLSEFVPLERVVYPAVRDCFMMMRDRTSWNQWNDKINDWSEKAADAVAKYPVRKPRKPGKLFQLTGNMNNYPGDRNPR